MSDLAGPDDLVGNRLGQIRWDGEPDADIARLGAVRRRQTGDRGVDADEFTIGIDQRTPGIAWVNRGAGLNGIGDDDPRRGII